MIVRIFKRLQVGEVCKTRAIIINPDNVILLHANTEAIFIVKTKGIEATTANWRGAISGVPAKYKAGVQGATNTIENAIAAEDLYAAKVSEAIANKSRVKGLQRTSTQEWKQRSSDLGSARIGPGMTAAEPKFRRGITDVINTIEATTIGPRSADPMANVDARVKPIVKALHDMARR